MEQIVDEASSMRVNNAPIMVEPQINLIRELHRAHEDLHNAEKRLVLQIKSIERRYAKMQAVLHATDSHTQSGRLSPLHTAHLQLGLDPIQGARKTKQRALERAVKELLVWPWVQSVRGFGPLGLGQIIGETGDLSNYATCRKVWKRMGMHVDDVTGKAAHRTTNKEAAERMGYVPRRRAIMYRLGEAFLKVGGPYRLAYDKYKVFYVDRNPDLAPFINHRRALRRAEKDMLRDLWLEWNRTCLSNI